MPARHRSKPWSGWRSGTPASLLGQGSCHCRALPRSRVPSRVRSGSASDMAVVFTGWPAPVVAAGSGPVRRVSRQGPGFSVSLPSMPVSAVRSSWSTGASWSCGALLWCSYRSSLRLGHRVRGGSDDRGELLTGFEGAGLGDRDLVGPGGRFGLEAAAVAVIMVAADDMQDPGHGDGEQRAEESEQLHADEDADQD